MASWILPKNERWGIFQCIKLPQRSLLEESRVTYFFSDLYSLHTTWFFVKCKCTSAQKVCTFWALCRASNVTGLKKVVNLEKSLVNGHPLCIIVRSLKYLILALIVNLLAQLFLEFFHPKDWPGKKVTILLSKFLMVKSSEIILFSNLHFNC